MDRTHAAPERIKTGIGEFDDILGGGLTARRVYLVHGTPGSGKTTLSLQFLIEGVRSGEKVLYVTLSETHEELEAIAQSHGLSTEGIEIFELISQEQDLDPDNQYTMFQPSEVELSVTTREILAAIDRIKPKRVVIDSLSEIKLLAQNALRFRRQVLSLKQYFAGRDCTVFFLDDKTSSGEDALQLESIAHGVISLEQLSPEYGAERRRLRVTKLRGQRYRGGYHDFSIVRGGLSVFPRIVAGEHNNTPQAVSVLKSGLPPLDTLLGGGIESGTSVLLLGPAGVGKSTLSLQYACEAASRDEGSIIFAFDERVETMFQRADGLNLPLRDYVDKGLIDIRAVDPAELSPGEFAHTIRKAVESDGERMRIVVIDSLNGYLNAMPEERFLTAQLHELLTYLGHRGIATFLVVAQHGLLGHAMTSTIDTSYLADTVILFRYFEASGEVRQLISVLKKRTGHHERSLREFSLGSDGIVIGNSLERFEALLTGTPVFKGRGEDLIHRPDIIPATPSPDIFNND